MNARAKGVKLGRPQGRTKAQAALEAKGYGEQTIRSMREAGATVSTIARMLGVDRRTAGAWLKAKHMG